jgi:hypothetical protein
VNGWEDQIISIMITPQPSGCIRALVIPYPDKNVTKFVVGHIAHKNSKGKKTL